MENIHLDKLLKNFLLNTKTLNITDEDDGVGILFVAGDSIFSTGTTTIDNLIVNNSITNKGTLVQSKSLYLNSTNQDSSPFTSVPSGSIILDELEYLVTILLKV